MDNLERTAEFAATFCEAMRADGREQTAITQALCVVGEAGEMVEALRRFTGYARRSGTLAEVAAEMADVEFSTCVYAYLTGLTHALCGYLRADPVVLADPPPVMPASVEVLGLLVDAAAGSFADLTARLAPFASPLAAMKLALLVSRNRLLAEYLGVDLDAAIAAKFELIMARGFGEQARAASSAIDVSGWAVTEEGLLFSEDGDRCWHDGHVNLDEFTAAVTAYQRVALSLGSDESVPLDGPAVQLLVAPVDRRLRSPRLSRHARAGSGSCRKR